MGVLFYLRSDGQYILVGYAVMAVFLFTIILCEVLIESGRSFLFKTRWTIYLAVDDGMAVFLFIVIMLSAMIDSGRSFLLKVR